jgi:L-ectoine synthase
MKYKTLDSVEQTGHQVEWGNGNSWRILTESDGLGYTLTKTTVAAGSSSSLQYKNHRESCFCVAGKGAIEVDGTVYPLVPGSTYVLDEHEPHLLSGEDTLHLVCVFTPALQGHETHNLNDSGFSSY